MKKSFQWKKSRQAAFQAGTRILLGIIIAASAICTVYIGRKPYGEELKEGDISLRTIYAPINFKYRLGIDEEKTRIEREKAAETINDVYDIDKQIKQDLINKTDQFYKQILSLQILKDATEEEKLEEAKRRLEIKTSESDLKTFLAEPKLEVAKDKTMVLLKELFSRGIITDTLKRKIIKSGQEYVLLRNLDTEKENKVSVDSFLTVDNVKKALTDKTQTLLPENRKLRVAVINLGETVLQPNLKFNQELTDKRRKTAFDSAPLQYKEKEVEKEELIISRGERVSKNHLLKIKEMVHRQVKTNRFMFFSGAVIMALIFLGIISIYLKFYEPKVLLGTRRLILIGTLFVLILGLAKIITYSPLPSYVIPTAIASILIAVLIGPRVAIIITVALSIFVGIIAGDKLNIATVSFVGGIVGIFAIQGARRRSQILSTGCLVGLANFACICGIELLHGLKYTVFLKEGFWGIINGLGAAIIITGILPVFEYLFNIATNISLLELSDLNHPLLKEMVLKAPGTYHQPDCRKSGRGRLR